MSSDLAISMAIVCVAGLAWDLGRKYLADRKQAYNARLSALLHEIDRERSDRIQQYADLRTVVNLKTGAMGTQMENHHRMIDAFYKDVNAHAKDLQGVDLAINRIDETHDELRSRVSVLAERIQVVADRSSEPPDISLLVPDIAALVKRQGVLETAIKNLGIEARSELAQRVTKAELEGELKNVRTTQAGMLALGGRRR